MLDILELFRGTLTQTPVYPREVVIEALARNAAVPAPARYHWTDGVNAPGGPYTETR